MTAHSSRPLNPLASFSGRFNPAPLPRPTLPEPVPCATCAGSGHGEPERCGVCGGTGRVLWVAGRAFPATARGRRLAERALRKGESGDE